MEAGWRDAPLALWDLAVSNLPNPIGIETKVTTNDDKSNVHSLTDSSIVPKSLTPKPKFLLSNW